MKYIHKCQITIVITIFVTALLMLNVPSTTRDISGTRIYDCLDDKGNPTICIDKI